MLSVVIAVLAATGSARAASYVSRPAESTIEPTLTQIEATAATASSISPSSDVKGIAFDRFYQIWGENTDYSAAAGNPDQQYLASQGITLTNYWATTHPSEPNYCAVVGGDNFGMDNDDFNAIPANISTVVDLLDTKGISWSEYQEAIPYPGFQGYNYSNQKTYANDYNFTGFEDDLNNMKLPQWSFITPNMTNDGHDTNITFESSWARNFLSPLMKNTYFMNSTLILLTFDETETYTSGNRPLAILLGGAIPDSLKGTKDDTFYTHYSAISTVSANWGLPSLGRWDCGANIFAIVANKTSYKNYDVDTTNLFMNQSYPGPLSDALWTTGWPSPEINAQCAAGNGVLAAVKSANAGSKPTFNYTNPYPYDEAAGINVNGKVSGGNGSASAPASSSSSSAIASSTASAASGSASNSASSTGSSTAGSASSTSSSASGASSLSIASAAALGLVIAGVVALAC